MPERTHIATERRLLLQAHFADIVEAEATIADAIERKESAREWIMDHWQAGDEPLSFGGHHGAVVELRHVDNDEITGKVWDRW